MTETMRRQAARKLRKLLDSGIARKQALLEVRKELRDKGLPSSERSLYEWCRNCGVSTK